MDVDKFKNYDAYLEVVERDLMSYNFWSQEHNADHNQYQSIKTRARDEQRSSTINRIEGGTYEFNHKEKTIQTSLSGERFLIYAIILHQFSAVGTMLEKLPFSPALIQFLLSATVVREWSTILWNWLYKSATYASRQVHLKDVCVLSTLLTSPVVHHRQWP